MSALFRRIPRRSYLPRWGRLRANSNAVLIIQFGAASVNLWEFSRSRKGPLEGRACQCLVAYITELISQTK